MISLLKATGGPGSIPFLALLIALGLVLIFVWPRRRRLGQVWLAGVCGIYLLLALPVIAHGITDGLPPIPIAPHSASPVAQLLILDGDNRRGRARTAVEIWASDRPKTVWVLGSSWMIDPLLQAGIPDRVARHDSSAANTLEQMRQVTQMAAEAAPGRTAVVASRLQAPRVAALAGALGTGAVVVPSPVDDEPPVSGIRRFIPSYIALRVSRDALYEHAALRWYARKGWLGEPGPATTTR